jgi:hypothetical protein
MLSEAFRKERGQTVRDLAEKANDPFTKKRLFDLAATYEGSQSRPATPLTPIDLQFKSQGTGSEQ